MSNTASTEGMQRKETVFKTYIITEGKNSIHPKYYKSNDCKTQSCLITHGRNKKITHESSHPVHYFKRRNLNKQNLQPRLKLESSAIELGS